MRKKSPTLNIKLISSTWAFPFIKTCEGQSDVGNDVSLLENALEDIQLRPIPVENEYFRLIQETGAIDQEYNGLTAILLAILLDELCKRAGRTWT